MRPKYETSIIIPTKNAGEGFERTLRAVFKQKKVRYEVIVIDSGSTDVTLEIVKKFEKRKNFRLVRIKPSEFGHGKTRNFGASLAKGKYLVFLTQDAVPADRDWLYHLIKNFNDKKVAGVYSRQIAKQDANPIEEFFYYTFAPSHKVIKSKSLLGKITLSSIAFSNVSSAIRKDIWKKYKFNEEIIMSEDQEWTKKVLFAGYYIVYEAESKVFHSHEYSLKQSFQRFFDAGFSLKVVTEMEPKIEAKFPFGGGIIYFLMELVFLIKKGHFAYIFYSPIYNFCKLSGFLLGRNYKLLPYSLRKKFSSFKAWW